MSACPASTPSPAESTRRVTAADSGPCASTPVSAPPESPNRRYRYLLEQGQTGISVAFDLPTQMGYDSDHHMSRGEVGKVGVPIDTLADMEVLFEDIPLEKVTTSMTINATASILLALYVAMAKKQGADLSKLGGTVQNDILKEYIARGTYIYPPRPSMRLITDLFRYCGENLSAWNTISISGYHMRKPGVRQSRSSPLPLVTPLPTFRPPWMRAWTWTSSAPGSPSSLSVRTTSWKRWPSSVPPERSGPG